MKADAPLNAAVIAALLKIDLTTEMHHRGIGMRHLGALRAMFWHKLHATATPITQKRRVEFSSDPTLDWDLNAVQRDEAWPLPTLTCLLDGRKHLYDYQPFATYDHVTRTHSPQPPIQCHALTCVCGWKLNPMHWACSHHALGRATQQIQDGDDGQPAGAASASSVEGGRRGRSDI